MRLVVIHSIEQANHWYETRLGDDLLVSSSALIARWIHQTWNISCYALSEFLEEADLRRHEEESLVSIQTITRSLDQLFLNEIQKFVGTPINLFRCLYGYYGQIWCSWTLSFQLALERTVSKLKPDEICVYDSPDFMIDLAGQLILADFVIALFPALKVIRGTNGRLAATNPPPFFRDLINRFKTHIKTGLKFLLSFLFGLGARHRVVFVGPLYELAFLQWIPWHCKRDYFPKGAPRSSEVARRLSEKIQQNSFWFDDSHKSVALLKKYILCDLQAALAEYLSELSLFIEQTRDKRTSFALWGSPPAGGSRGGSALIVEYLRAKKIPVGGSQHGGCYAYQKFPRHLESDYLRCDTFFSLGANYQDITQSLHIPSLPCDVVALGRTPTNKKRKAHRNDPAVLYPITNWLSWFGGGIHHLPIDHRFVEFQFQILTWLKKESALSATIKFAFWDRVQLKIISENLGASFPHLKLISHVPFKKYALENPPRLILIDCPSTPLLEALDTSAQILVLEDKFYPFTDSARKLMDSRFHIAQTTDQFFNLLDAWKQGTLPIKLDPSFSKAYYCESPSQRWMLKKIEAQLLP